MDFGKPFDDWDLPEGFGVLRRRLEGELAKAVDRALQIGALTGAVLDRIQPICATLLNRRLQNSG